MQALPAPERVDAADRDEALFPWPQDERDDAPPGCNAPGREKGLLDDTLSVALFSQLEAIVNALGGPLLAQSRLVTPETLIRSI